MRLADFIRACIEPILVEWDSFAQTLSPGQSMSKAGLRDHAKAMLLAIAEDMDAPQSTSEQLAKSKARASQTEEKSPAELHGSDRQVSGFTINAAAWAGHRWYGQLMRRME